MQIWIHDNKMRKIVALNNDIPDMLSYTNSAWHSYLYQATSTFDFTIPKFSNGELHEELKLINDECFVSFYVNDSYQVFYIATLQEDDFNIQLTCNNTNLEYALEYADPFSSDSAQTIEWYLNKMYFLSYAAVEIGNNEISDRKRTLTFDSQETKMTRLQSLMSKFDAEFEFKTELNRDGTYKRIAINIYQKDHIGTDRKDVLLYYSNGLKGVQVSSDKTQMFTSGIFTGKDGLNLANVEISEKNSDGIEEFYSRKGDVYLRAPLAMQRYPSTMRVEGQDNWINKNFQTEYENVNDLKAYALRTLKQYAYPLVTYTASVQSGFVSQYTDLKLGDTIRIIDKNFVGGLALEARVSEMIISFDNPANNSFVFTNYRKLDNKPSSALQTRIEQAVESKLPYRIELATTGGVTFKNNEGETIVKPSLYKGNLPYTTDVTWRWALDGVVTVGMQYLARAENIDGTAVLTVSAYVGNNEVATTEITLTDVNDGDDGVGVESIDRYFTSSDQSDGVTIEGAEWSDKPPAPTEDGKYLWAYDEITYTDGTVTTTKPSAVGANFDVDAFRAEIAEDLKDVPNREEFENKIAEELANSKAEIETQIETAKTQAESNAKEYADTINQETAKVAELANAAADEIKADLVNVKNNLTDTSLVANNAQAAVDAAKQDLTEVANELSTAKQGLADSVAEVNTKADNAKAEIDKAKQDLTNVASDLNTAKQDLSDSVTAVNTKVDGAKAELTQTKQQLTTVADDLSKAKTDLQTAVSAVDTKATNLKSDLSQAKQDLNSQAQQLQEQASAQSELNKRVSSVEKTANGTKTTVNELTKTVAQNGKDITSVTARTKVVEDDLSGTKTTLSQVKTTADSASQKTATLETGLNGLNARFDSLKIGSVNLLKNSKTFKGSNITGKSTLLNETYQGCAVRYLKSNNSTSGYQEVAQFSKCVYPELGGEYVVSFWAKGSGTFTTYFYGSDGYLQVASTQTSQGRTGTAFDGTIIFTLAEDWERYWVRYKLKTAPSSATSVAKHFLIRHIANGKEDEIWLAGVQLEKGNIATDYSPNEADIEQKVAEYKQTADQNYASLQTTVQNLDGTVQQNKTTAEQTAAGFKTRIESLETYKNGESERANAYFESAKTETAKQLTAERTAIAKDYVAKSTYTSDVTGIRNDLTATTTTANTIKTNLANYQASNDRAVASLKSSLQTTDGNVSNLQTKVEAVPGQITSAVSSVESKIPTEIGTVNLLKNSKSFTGSNIGGSGNILSETYQGCAVRHLKVTGEVAIAEFRNCVYPKLGGEYVASFWAKGSGVLRVYFHGDSGYLGVASGLTSEGNATNSGDGSIAFNLTANWKRYWLKYKLKSEPASATSVGKRLLFRTPPNGSENEVYLAGVKLEEGNVASGYEPSPEDTASQISSLSSEIKQTADGISLLATKTELNTAKSDLQSGINTATNKANAAQNTANSAQNKANSNAQTISTHTTQISALNTGLQAKVSQTDFNTLSGRVTTAENNITAKANELSSKITSVEDAIEDTQSDITKLSSEIKQTADGMTLLATKTELNTAKSDLQSGINTATNKANAAQNTANSAQNKANSNAQTISTHTTQISALNTGLQAKVSQTDFNTLSGRVTTAENNITAKANELSSKITSVEDAIEDTQSDITKLSSEIKQTADGMTLLATKTELNTAKSDLQSGINTATNKANSAQSTADSAVTKANAAQSSANSNAQTISTHTTQISALNTGLQAKVSQTDFNTLSGRVTTAENNITAKANELSSKISSVEGKIPTTVGGRNYLRGTSDKYKTYTSSNYLLGYANSGGTWNDMLNPLRGKNVTLRAYIKNDTDFPVRIQLWTNTGGVNGNAIPAHSEGWSVGTGKMSADWTNANVAFVQAGNGANNGGTIQAKEAKLEVGNIPSDWSPAPEDTQSDITKLSSEIKQTADGMTLLATKTELNTAKSDLQSGISTATNKADAAQNTANSAQNTANSNAQTISTHTTQISALNTGLQAKVSQTDFNTLSGRVTTAENNITAKANELSSKITSVEGKIPTEIGSSNLLRNTAVNADNLNLFEKSNSTINVATKDGHQTYKIVVSANDSGVKFKGNARYYNLIKDRTYTFSFWVLTNKDKPYSFNSLGHIQVINENGDIVGSDKLHQHSNPIYSTNTIKANTWTKVWCTFKATSNSYFKPYLWYLNAGDEIYIYDMMLNEGKVPLSYTPAPEDTAEQISSLSSELKQTADGITLLATKTELNTAKNELQSGINTATNKADAAQNTANSAQNTANSNAQTISTHTTQISALNTGLQAKVSQTEFNTLSGRVTSAENNITAKANELSSKITSVEGKIPTSVGGRNLLSKTNQGKTNWSWNISSGGAIIEDFDTYGVNVVKMTRKSDAPVSWSYIQYDGLIRNLIEPDTKYTLSFDVKPSVDVTFSAALQRGDGGALLTNAANMNKALANKWTKVSCVLTSKTTLPDDLSQVVYLSGMPTANGNWLIIKNIKLEKGVVSSDWSPAPEDTAEQISNLSSEIKQTADGMTLLATKTEVNSAKSELQSGISTATNKANAAQNTANSAQSTANNNAQTISTHTTQISALNTGLQAKVSQSDFNTLSGRVTSAENNITAKANELSSKITSVEGKIPTSVGGRNYLRGTSDKYKTYTSTNYLLGYPSTDRDWTKLLDPLRGKNVTLRAYIKNDTDFPVRIQVWTNAGVVNSNSVAPHSEGWSVGTGKMPADWTSANVAFVQVGNGANNGGTIQAKEAKLEIGNIPSDWSPAPEDYDSKLATAQSEFKQTTDAIKASVSSLDNSTVKSSSLTINADGIVMKAGKSTTDVANAIGSYFAVNQNAINLFSDKINVKGNMIVSGAITSDKIASKSINTAHLNGKIITADVISSNAVTTGAIKAGAVTTDKMSANSINGDRITAGTLDAAKIKAGSITASQIASGTITSNQIKAGGISAANIAAGAITANKIAAGAIDASKIAANAISSDKIVSSGITANVIKGGTLQSLSGATNFELDTGKLFYNNNNTGVFRIQDGASTMGLKFSNTPISVNGTSRILSRAILGGDRRETTLDDGKWDKGGFSGVIIETIKGIGPDQNEKADSLCVISDNIFFTHTYSADPNGASARGWKMETYSPESSYPGNVVLKPYGINYRNSNIVTGDIRFENDDGSGYWMRTIISILKNCFEHIVKGGTSSAALNAIKSDLNKISGI